MGRVLIACEESQIVCKEFRKLGHNAYSCDIIEPSGGHPEWHIQDDVLNHLDDGWDMMIAHPVCKYLANSGVSWLYRIPGRWEMMQLAAEFFKKLLDANIPKKAIENPIIHKYAVNIIGRRQDQVIQPWMFGHPEKKATCLWLENLPKLIETDNVKREMENLPINQQQRIHYMPPNPERAKLRSKTFLGIARAMAEQWGKLLTNHEDAK